MDNALIADGVIISVLLVGALLGAKRGLIKSLMGLFLIVGALAGAMALANRLTDPLSGALAAKVEMGAAQYLETQLSDEATGIGGALRAVARDQLAELLRSVLSVGVHVAVRAAVHTALVLVGFLVLVVVLKLLGWVLERVFDLPVLNMTNRAAGAVFGLLEAGAFIFVLLFFASRLGMTAIADYAEGSRLMPFFTLRPSFRFMRFFSAQ